jgi:hypothetical protein
MPREKEGQKQRGIMAPVETWDALDALAARNHRTAAQELLHAVERHLASPPEVTVTVVTPPIRPAALEVPATPEPKKRGRKPRARKTNG